MPQRTHSLGRDAAADLQRMVWCEEKVDMIRREGAGEFNRLGQPLRGFIPPVEFAPFARPTIE